MSNLLSEANRYFRGKANTFGAPLFTEINDLDYKNTWFHRVFVFDLRYGTEFIRDPHFLQYAKRADMSTNMAMLLEKIWNKKLISLYQNWLDMGKDDDLGISANLVERLTYDEAHSNDSELKLKYSLAFKYRKATFTLFIDYITISANGDLTVKTEYRDSDVKIPAYAPILSSIKQRDRNKTWDQITSNLNGMSYGEYLQKETNKVIQDKIDAQRKDSPYTLEEDHFVPANGDTSLDRLLDRISTWLNGRSKMIALSLRGVHSNLSTNNWTDKSKAISNDFKVTFKDGVTVTLHVNGDNLSDYNLLEIQDLLDKFSQQNQTTIS